MPFFSDKLLMVFVRFFSFIFILVVLTKTTFAAPLKAKSTSLKDAQTHVGAIEDDEDDDEDDKFELHQDEDDGGDPYPRYTEASSKDGNCDPNFLLELYREYAFATCNLSMAGTCVKLWDSSQFWWGYVTTTASATTINTTLDALQRYSRVGDLRNQSKMGLLDDAGKIELEKLNRQFLNETQKLRLGSKGKLVFRSFAKGSAWGIAAYAGLIFANSELGSKAWDKVQDFTGTNDFNLKSCRLEERDPLFRNFVPIQTDTCKTPLYEIGHEKVVAFLDLPAQEQLKALDNKLTCGYYKSLNAELVRRNGQEDNRGRIEKVRCDHASGKITFQFKKPSPAIETTLLTINRKPGTQEFESYKYEKTIKDSLQEAAIYDLAKKEDDIQLVKIRIEGRNKPVMVDRIAQYEKASPVQSKNVLGAFRAVRRVSRNLAMCCDLDPPTPPTESEKSNPKKKRNVKKRNKQVIDYARLCPKDWFVDSPREPIVTPTSNSKATR